MCQVKQTTITTTNNNSYRTMIFCLSSSVEGDTGAVLRFIRMCVVTHTIRRFCAVQSAAKRDTQPQSQSTRLTAKRWHNHRFSIIAYTKFELQSVLEAARWLHQTGQLESTFYSVSIYTQNHGLTNAFLITRNYSWPITNWTHCQPILTSWTICNISIYLTIVCQKSIKSIVCQIYVYWTSAETRS